MGLFSEKEQGNFVSKLDGTRGWELKGQERKEKIFELHAK